MAPKRNVQTLNSPRQAKRQRLEICSLCHQRQQCIAATFPKRAYFLLALVPSLSYNDSLFEKETDDIRYLASCIRNLVDQPDLCQSVLTRLSQLLRTKQTEEYKVLLSKEDRIDAKREYEFLVHLVEQLENRSGLLLTLLSDSANSLDTLFLIEVTLTRALAILTIAHKIKLKEDIVVLSDSECIDLSLSDAVNQPIAETTTTTIEASAPDYEALSTPELRAKLKSYGYKSGGRRAQMIEDLKSIFSSLHQAKSAAKVKSKLIEPEEQEEGAITAKEPLDPEKRHKIVKHLKENSTLWNQILRFEQVNINECHVGLDCKKSELKIVLDEYAAGNDFKKRKKNPT